MCIFFSSLVIKTFANTSCLSSHSYTALDRKKVEAPVTHWVKRWPVDSGPDFESRGQKSFQLQTGFHCTQLFLITLPLPDMAEILLNRT